MPDNPRYQVVSARRRPAGFIPSTERVAEQARTRDEANTLYDIMLEDESMVGPIWVYDLSNGRIVRYSMDENEQPL